MARGLLALLGEGGRRGRRGGHRMLFFVNWLGVFTVRNERVTALFFPSKDKKKSKSSSLFLSTGSFLSPPSDPPALSEREKEKER